VALFDRRSKECDSERISEEASGSRTGNLGAKKKRGPPVAGVVTYDGGVRTCEVYCLGVRGG